MRTSLRPSPGTAKSHQRRDWRCLALAGACACLGPAASAQTIPNALATQEILRQQERERALREQLERSPDVRLPSGVTDDRLRLPESETPCFTIGKIVLKSAVPAFDFALAAADAPGDAASGRCLGSNGIQLVMKRIQDAIVARGYVTTRVLAEAQDLREGVLTLTVIPGRIRAIRFGEESGARANAWNAVPAAPGDLLNLRDLEQALENFKRVPTAEADVQIVAADAPGESDIVITWKQSMPLRLSISANDAGSESTGTYQGNVSVSGDHLLGLNDLFYASFNHDLGGGKSGERGSRGHTLHYSVPFDYWLMSATSNRYRYHQEVAGASQTFIYSGTTENHEVRLARLIYRDASNKTTASLRAYLTESDNFVDDSEVVVERRRMAGWEAALAHRAFVGAITLDASLAYRRGTGAFDALSVAEQANGEGTARPHIVSAESTLSVPFALGEERLRYTGVWRAQWNRTPLVAQDRFSIGGRYTVRGFDGETVLLAERGWLIRNDVAWTLGGSGQELYAGIDHGEVGGRSARLLVGKRLTGAVVGLRGGYRNASWDFFVGRPLRKPGGFETPRTTGGFNVSLSF